MAEDDALEDAIEGGDDGEDMDPLAEEMLKMMEEEGDGEEGEGVDSMMEMEMLKAMEEEGGTPVAAVPGGAGGGVPPNIARLMDVRLTVTIVLGRTQKTIQEVMGMSEQALVELDKTVGDPVDVEVNGKLFARGEVVTVSENFGVRITELIAPLGPI
jgi:flagellar motor switch protein FliN